MRLKNVLTRAVMLSSGEMLQRNATVQGGEVKNASLVRVIIFLRVDYATITKKVIT